MSADLCAALAPPTVFGPKLFEITMLLAIVAACKPIKDDGDLLLLRETLIEELGPAYMWLIMLSVVEWDTLLDDQKAQDTNMRLVWLSSYIQQSLGSRAPASSPGGVYENPTRLAYLW
jgi:hypothetical protein